MSDEFQFLRVKSLSMKTTRSHTHDDVITRVMRHNLREIHAEFGTTARGTIDPLRIRFNQVLSGLDTADGVAREAQVALKAAGVKLRKNAALGIELVLSLPAGTKIDTHAYFADAVRWALRFFAVPLLSAVVHADEDYPHAHIVMLPLRDGRLIASELLGDRKATKAMQADFHEQVGKRYGLRLPRPQKRHSAAVRHDAIQLVFDVLHRNSGLEPNVLLALLEPHNKNPEPLLNELGLMMPESKPNGSFVEIMTRPCALKKPNRVSGHPLIGDLGGPNEGANGLGERNPYALLGVSFPERSIPPPEQTSASTSPQASEAKRENARANETRSADVQREAHDYTADTDQAGEPVEQYTRERDDERPSGEFDTIKGAWIHPRQNTGSKRALAATQVQEALSRAQLPQQPCSTTDDKPECSEPRKQDDEEGGD